MPRFLIPLLSLAASAASALTFTTHFPLTRGSIAYAVSPSSASVVYAVQAGILYRSSDGGVTFETRSAVAGANVVVDPTDAGIVYDAGGLRRSDDGGATWKRFGDGAFGTRLVIHPANPAELRLFGACSSSHPAQAGVFVSHDRGDTSRQVVGGPRVLYGLPTSPRNLILYSDDGGAEWRRFGQSQPIGDSIDVLAFDGVRLFAGTTAGLFVSANDLPFWQQVPAAPPGPVLGLTIAGDVLYVATANGCYRAPLATLDPFTPVAALPLVPGPLRYVPAWRAANRRLATSQSQPGTNPNQRPIGPNTLSIRSPNHRSGPRNGRGVGVDRNRRSERMCCASRRAASGSTVGAVRHALTRRCARRCVA